MNNYEAFHYLTKDELAKWLYEFAERYNFPNIYGIPFGLSPKGLIKNDYTQIRRWLEKETGTPEKGHTIISQVIERLKMVSNANLCQNCDGCGYEEGCQDETCGTYQARKCLELLETEEEE